jgi:hypothetical protein
MRINSSRLALWALSATLLAGLAGCSGNGVARQVAAMNTANIQRVANLYSAFQNYKGGRGPKDAGEFKTFVKAFDATKLAMMGVDPNKVDELFTSERDGKPFKIRYRVGGGRGSVAAVAFEQDGQDGQKQVAFTGNSRVEAVDGTAYAQLWAGRGEAQPPAAPPVQKGRGGRPPGAPTGPQG